MAQGVLAYKYEEEKTTTGMTALAGLPVYLDLAFVLGLGDHIRAHLHVKAQGWADEQIITSLVLLNLAGRDSVDDIRILDKDEGFCKVLGRVETKGRSRLVRKRPLTMTREKTKGRRSRDGWFGTWALHLQESRSFLLGKD